MSETIYLSGAIYIQNNSSDSLLYTYADNQGSLIALTEEDGTIINKFAYDPWGKRRSATNWTLSATPPSGGWGAFNRGYTGHEHLDAFGIINMNGRVFDPATAMFFSPDPFIQSGGEWKNYNRYSYCMNNPTRYTDPSGYKYCYIDMPAFDDNASNWMRAASGGGGKNSALKLWDAPHRGSISYNWENGKYYYANGDEASFQEALDKWSTSSDAKTYYGRDASTAYKSIRYGSEATNKALANIRNSAKAIIAEGIANTNNNWNSLLTKIASSYSMSSVWNSLILRVYVADIYQIGVSTDLAYYFGFGNSPINIILLTRGEPGIYLAPTINAALGDGIGASAVITYSSGWYTGDPQEIRSNFLQGNAVGGSAAAGVILDVAVSGSCSFAGNGHGFISFGGQFGFGIEGSPSTVIHIQANYQRTLVAKPLVKF